MAAPRSRYRVGHLARTVVGSRRVARRGLRRMSRLAARPIRRFLSMSSSPGLSMIVLGKEDDPSLAPLKSLPKEARILGYGSSPEMFDKQSLAAAQCVFCTVSGNAASTLPGIYSGLSSATWVHSQLAGVDKLMFPEFCADDKVVLTNARGVYTWPLVEYSIFALMYFAKDYPRLRRNQIQKVWDQFFVEEIRGRTLGVVGYGDIGRACAKKAKEAFGMKVVAMRRRPGKSDGDDVPDQVFGADQMLEMLSLCDYVLCAAPLTPQTKHMFNKKAFEAMKPSAVFLNIGRGEVCEEVALVEALKSGTIKGAALDVFEQEPLSTDSELWGLDNLLFSPHNADLTTDCRRQATEHFVSLVSRKLAGESIDECLCDKSVGY